jgi:hypothetical protein
LLAKRRNGPVVSTDFDAKRETYYDLLQAPKNAGEFIEEIQTAMRHWLAKLNAGMPTNPKVRLREKGKRRIAATPLDKQPEPPNTAALKREIGRRWADVDLRSRIRNSGCSRCTCSKSAWCTSTRSSS